MKGSMTIKVRTTSLSEKEQTSYNDVAVVTEQVHEAVFSLVDKDHPSVVHLYFSVSFRAGAPHPNLGEELMLEFGPIGETISNVIMHNIKDAVDCA